jgi:hypothetical protein
MTIEIGDTVLATKGEFPSVLTALFEVTGIEGTSYQGAPTPIDTADGWMVEVGRKAITNLHLPTSLSEIDAKLSTTIAITLLTGKGENWRDETGQAVPVESILDWSPHEDA